MGLLSAALTWLQAGAGRELSTGYLPEPPPPLRQALTDEQAGRSWSKPGWDVLVAWLKHKIILLSFGGLGIMLLNTTFHIFSY